MIVALILLGVLCVVGLAMICAEAWYDEQWHGWDDE